jgi:hypothetical protein
MAAPRNGIQLLSSATGIKLDPELELFSSDVTRHRMRPLCLNRPASLPNKNQTGESIMISTSVPEVSLTSRAMLCSLTISMWSARKHDKDASEEIAVRHGAQSDAGRYHKILLPKAALAEIQKIVSDAFTGTAFDK